MAPSRCFGTKRGVQTVPQDSKPSDQTPRQAQPGLRPSQPAALARPPTVAGFARIRTSPRQPSEFWRIQLQRFCDAAIG
nr:DUF1589 domain-containing protein [Rhodopirellula islandica]